MNISFLLNCINSITNKYPTRPLKNQPSRRAEGEKERESVLRSLLCVIERERSINSLLISSSSWHLFMNYQQSRKEMKLNLNKFNCEQKVLLGCLLISLLFQNIGQAAAFENEFQNQEEVRDKK